MMYFMSCTDFNKTKCHMKRLRNLKKIQKSVKVPSAFKAPLSTLILDLDKDLSL